MRLYGKMRYSYSKDVSVVTLLRDYKDAVQQVALTRVASATRRRNALFASFCLYVVCFFIGVYYGAPYVILLAVALTTIGIGVTVLWAEHKCRTVNAEVLAEMLRDDC